MPAAATAAEVFRKFRRLVCRGAEGVREAMRSRRWSLNCRSGYIPTIAYLADDDTNCRGRRERCHGTDCRRLVKQRDLFSRKEPLKGAAAYAADEPSDIQEWMDCEEKCPRKPATYGDLGNRGTVANDAFRHRAKGRSVRGPFRFPWIPIALSATARTPGGRFSTRGEAIGPSSATIDRPPKNARKRSRHRLRSRVRLQHRVKLRRTRITSRFLLLEGPILWARTFVRTGCRRQRSTR